jgi:hypothetical protein
MIRVIEQTDVTKLDYLSVRDEKEITGCDYRSILPDHNKMITHLHQQWD